VLEGISRWWRRRQVERTERQLNTLERRLEQDERARKGKLSPGESVTAPGIPSGSVPWSPSGGEGITSRAGFGRTGTRFRG